MAEFASRLPIWVICRLVGVPSDDDELVRGLILDLMQRTPGEDATPEVATVAVRELSSYSERLAEDKRRAPADDLMSHLVAGEAKNSAPEPDEIAGMALLLFVGGFEATAQLLGNTLLLLSQHPHVQAALRSEPAKLIDAVIEESLRLETPVQYFERRTTTSVQVCEAEIPEGATVMLLYGAANRDERRFENAEAFDVSRARQRHLTFGEGIHFCLGAHLARLEARIAVPAFLRSFAAYEIEAPLERYPSHIMRGYAQLPAIVHRAR